MSRVATAGVLVAVLIVAVVGALVVAGGQQPRRPVAGSPLETHAGESASARPTVTAASAPRSGRGPAYDPAVSRAPTAQPPQSKLWFAHGRWWGVLASSDGTFTIHWLDWRTQQWHDTNTLVDDRSGARADVLWANDRLYVASGGSRPTAAADAIRVLRFRYDPTTVRYALDDGFPVTVTAGGADDTTIARDGSGRLWLAYLGADGLALRNSVGDDRVWSSPFRPSVGAGAFPAEAAAVVAQPDRTVLVWTPASENAMYSATHPVGADPTTGWTVARTAVEGLTFGTDQIDLKASAARAGPVLAAIRTSLGERDAPNPRDPQILLLRLQPGGEWVQHVVSLVTDRGAWPVISLDEERSVVTVLAVAPGAGGRVYAKSAALDALDFGVGIGSIFVASDQDAQINRPTTTKQPVSAATGLVIVGADDRTGQYVHGAAALGGPPPGSAAAAERSPGSGEADVVVFSDVFDPYPDGAPVGNGWELADPASGRLTIANVPSTADRSARLAAASPAVAASACRRVPAFETGDLTVDGETMVFGGPATSDAKLIAVRGGGLELASVRMNADGSLAYYRGAARTPVPNAFARARWYAISLTMHLAARTYDWTMTDSATGRAVAAATGAAWRNDRPPDRVCFETATGPGSGLLFDDVRVSR